MRARRSLSKLRRNGGSARTRFTRLLGVSACVLVGFAISAAAAAAEPLCTDTWTGPAEGSWSTAANWSTGVPTSSSVACIAAGKTVLITTTATTGVLEDKGTVEGGVGGKLIIESALEPSAAATLVLHGGQVDVASGTLNVSSSFTIDESGQIYGSGSLVVKSGATATIGQMSLLQSASLVNEGTATLSSGRILETETTVLRNTGTFKANSQHAPAIERLETHASIVNTGLWEKTSGTGETIIQPPFESTGTIDSVAGELWFGGTSTSSLVLGNSTVEGTVGIRASTATVTAGNLEASKATLSVGNGFSPAPKLTISSGHTATIKDLVFNEGYVQGAGSVLIGHAISSGHGTLAGSARLTLPPGTASTIERFAIIESARLVNEGTLTLSKEMLQLEESARFENQAAFQANSEETGALGAIQNLGGSPLIVNDGSFKKTAGTGTTRVTVQVESLGSIIAETGKFEFTKAPITRVASTLYGEGGEPGQACSVCGEPVNVATGNETDTQTDLRVGGRGVSLDLARTYNSQAGAEGAKGPFGYGWTSTFGEHLGFNAETHKVTLTQAKGATIPFTQVGTTILAPIWTQDKLVGSTEAGYSLTLPDQTVEKFSGSSGRLESITDRNGNETKLAYSEAGRLESVTDPASRKLSFAYNGEGLVESVKDPMGHTVKYGYEAGNLTSVTLPGEASANWKLKYDGSHQLTELTDGRGGVTTSEYKEGRVIAQTDPLKHKLVFEYFPLEAVITNEATKAQTLEKFTHGGEPEEITRGWLTASKTVQSYTYNEAGYVTSETDGNKHTTEYGYDAEGNRTSKVDPTKNETQWEYDGTHDVTAVTNPKSETTTIKRDSHGNAEAIERPAPASKTQIEKYKYDAHGDLEQVTDPLERVSKFEYDSYGDRTAEIDPEGDKRTWAYDEDSRVTSSVSPRGNAEGAEASKYTTKIERDAQERPIKVTDPLGHATKYGYDGDGNLEKLTDPNGHATTYTNDADNELTKVKEANGDVTETGYDGAGRVISQTDGNKHTTKYDRNVLGEVVLITDPLSQKTTKEYDKAGNVTMSDSVVNLGTFYKYDAANRITEVSYSFGNPSAIKYDYDADGERTQRVDGTGTSKYTYDQLDRLTESKDGHGDVVGYEYDLANEPTKLTYPNGKAITREYDKAGRLKSVTDWSEHTTKFGYDANSNETSTVWPSGTSEEDGYTFNEADQLAKVEMNKGAESLASLTYTRDGDGQLKTAAQTGLPGEAETAYSYDEDNRLTKAGSTAYEYDAANNPTKLGSSSNEYDADDELTKGSIATYTHNALGERTKTTPSSGPAMTYGYDEADNLTSVSRPEEGETPAIEDSYVYDGDGLRASQTISGTTAYLAWDIAGGIPSLLSDGINSYIYGPGELPIEQVTGETVRYLHHDQQGSTRLLTGSSGAKEASVTYDAFGNKLGSTGTASTPLGYDGQYTSPDTGLTYLSARSYDPSTGQFVNRDPVEATTRTPYVYAVDNPLTYQDRSGLDIELGPISIPTPSPEEVGDAIAGFGDTVTFGATEWVREQIGDNNIDACSGAYQAGGFGALATAALIPGEGEAELAAEGADLAATGRTAATGLSEQLAMEQAVSDPAAGKVLDVTMTDPRWPASGGWVKMAQNINGTEIHYVRNLKTGAAADFKYVP